MKTIPFYKMHGSGNDFILLDNRELALPPEVMPLWAKALCRRAFSVGADGLIVLEPADAGADVRWHFFNADGSRAEMCGNGSRCAAALAYRLGMAPATLTLATDAGPVRAQVFAETDEVQVQLTELKDRKLDMALDVDGTTVTVHFANTGVPHAVVLVPDVAAVDVAHMGRSLRFHPAFAPAGTNANFAQVIDRGRLLLRTYERGVEAETYACGTGAAATAAVAHALGLTDDTVRLTTSGGEELGVTVRGNQLQLRGKAVFVFRGELPAPPTP
ncbi:MAG: diaminopimelate epimerase [Desulfomicrobiaceae bacterium]|nr:diaminopimelate epimerase [Desulfomicrobiaceae bacterium]